MARIKWWSHLLNDEGQPIEGANISIYLAGTTTAAVIYTSESGSATISVAPHLVTNQDGYFEFWIGDSSDSNGYSSMQKFKIAFNKAGVVSGYNDYISIYAAFIPVDLTSSDASKDKTISNLYGQRWENHRLDDTHTVHGIQEVTVTSSDTTKNKLVSNFYAKGWEDHKDLDYNETPHGIELVDETDTDATKNKLVSNLNAKEWEDHKDLDYNETPHNIGLADETSSDLTKDKLVSNNQLKVLYDRTYSESVSASSLVSSGGYYFYDIIHNFNDNYPILMAYDTSTDEIINPKDIFSLDINTTRIWFNSSLNFEIKLKI